jgi:hypothetical protein
MGKAEWDTFRNVNNPTVTAHVDRSARFMIIPVFKEPAAIIGYRVVPLIADEEGPTDKFTTYTEAKRWAEGKIK